MQSDRIAGAATVAAGAALALASFAIETSPAQPELSARFFPLLLSSALVVLGIALLIQSGGRELSLALRQLFAPGALVFGGLLLAYFLSFRYVDFRLNTWLFMLVAMIAMGSRRPLELIAVPLGVSLGIYALFRHGFAVLLPVWM